MVKQMARMRQKQDLADKKAGIYNLLAEFKRSESDSKEHFHSFHPEVL